ncbi:MAG: FHA domain-containing protein [Galbitalea sp.]
MVPFGTTQEVLAPDAAASSITITSPPPGIGEPPAAPAAPFVGTAPPPVAAAPTAESLDETRVSVRRRAGIHWRLVLPDAGHIEVATALLVGRDPAANATWPAAVLLAVDDDTHSVSKTHAVFEVDADGLWVTDLDSTNGVVIAQPDGTELDLDPNVRTAIQPGADVELGDFIIQVEKD